MKRRAIIGLSIMVLVLAIVFGIASLPDEVLIGPSSQNFQPKSEEFQFVPPNEESETIYSALGQGHVITSFNNVRENIFPIRRIKK